MIQKLDHLVITTARIKPCLEFYEKLGFSVRDAGERYELFAGDFKINVHISGHELFPHAGHVRPGSADLCFAISGSIEQCKMELEQKGLEIELGAVPRHGVNGPMRSVYLRDPDHNLIELCSYE